MPSMSTSAKERRGRWYQHLIVKRAKEIKQVPGFTHKDAYRQAACEIKRSWDGVTYEELQAKVAAWLEILYPGGVGIHKVLLDPYQEAHHGMVVVSLCIFVKAKPGRWMTQREFTRDDISELPIETLAETVFFASLQLADEGYLPAKNPNEVCK